MHLKCLDCNYSCGTPYILLLHYKTEQKDKVSKCACGNQTKSGNCVEEISFKLRGTASKWSSYSSNLRSSFTDSSPSSIYSSNPKSDSNFNSYSHSSSNSNSDSNSHLRSSFTDSNSNSNSNSSSNSNSNFNFNTASNFNSNSNLQSNWGTMGEAPLAC